MLDPTTPGRYRPPSSSPSKTPIRSQGSTSDENQYPTEAVSYPALFPGCDKRCSPSSIVLPRTPVGQAVAPLTRNKANISLRRTKPDLHLFSSPPRTGHADKVHDIFEAARLAPLPPSPFPSRHKDVGSPSNSSLQRAWDSHVPLVTGRTSGPALPGLAESATETEDSLDEVGKLPRARIKRIAGLSRVSSDDWTGDDEFLGLQKRHPSMSSDSAERSNEHGASGQVIRECMRASPACLGRSAEIIKSSRNSTKSSRFVAMPQSRIVPKTPLRVPFSSRQSSASSEEVIVPARRVQYPVLTRQTNTGTPDGISRARRDSLQTKSLPMSPEKDTPSLWLNTSSSLATTDDCDDADEESDSSSNRSCPRGLPSLSPKVQISRGGSQDATKPRSSFRDISHAVRQRCASYEDEDILTKS